MKPLERMFLRPQIIKKEAEIVETIKKSFQNYFFRAGVSDPDIWDYLCVPDNFDKWKDHQNIKQDFKLFQAQFNQYGFQLPRIRILEANKQFLERLQNSKLNKHLIGISNPKPQWLEQATLLATAPSTRLILKYYWICLGYNEAYKYNGLVADTSPVRNFKKFMFGRTFADQPLESTMIEKEIAEAINKDVMFVNSAMWYYGQQLANV